MIAGDVSGVLVPGEPAQRLWVAVAAVLDRVGVRPDRADLDRELVPHQIGLRPQQGPADVPYQIAEQELAQSRLGETAVSRCVLAAAPAAAEDRDTEPLHLAVDGGHRLVTLLPDE